MSDLIFGFLIAVMGFLFLAAVVRCVLLTRQNLLQAQQMDKLRDENQRLQESAEQLRDSNDRLRSRMFDLRRRSRDLATKPCTGGDAMKYPSVETVQLKPKPIKTATARLLDGDVWAK